MTSKPTIANIVRHGALVLLRMFAGRPGGALLPPGQVRRVLLIRHDRIGDAVITTPLLSALKYLAPDVEIDVVASPANSTIFRHDARVSRVFVWNRSLLDRLRLIRACRQRRYDLAFQLILGRTTLPAILTGLLAPKGLTIGKSMPGHDFLFDRTVLIPDVHFSDRTVMLLGGGIRIDTPLPRFPYALDIPAASVERAGRVLGDAGLGGTAFILLNISASTRIRELSDEQNVAVAKGLAAHGYRVAVTGGPEASERIGTIAAAAGACALRFGSILDAAAGMGKSLLVVTPDTGTLHIATAMGVPVVAMFVAPGHPEGWAPRDIPHRILRASTGNSLTAINVDDVIAAATELLGVSG